MAELSVTREELDELGGKLEAADLSDKEREVLLTVFAIAANAMSDQEVSGFGFTGLSIPPGGGLPSLRGGLSMAFNDSFISGPRSDGDGPGQGGIHITNP